MNARSLWLSGRVCVVMLFAAMLCVAGCSKKAPEEANAALNAALGALPKGEAKTFADAVLSAQREKVTTLKEWPFFQAVKSHKIDNEFDLEVTDDSAMILTSLYFDDKQKAFSTVYFVMKKADGKWCIDLAETIKKERSADGEHAFNVYKFITKPE